MFFPIDLEEGFGLNIRLLKEGSKSDLSLGAGFGLTQTFNNNVFKEDTSDTTSVKIYNELESVFLSGIEGTISGDFKISNNITYLLELTTLLPFDKERSQTYSIQNSVDFRISNLLSINYTLSLDKSENYDWTVQNHNLSLTLTFISF